mmetsp:Transcript_23410/g.61499  ORF Transcript_23410/g.61499 Transcript_23410/m.61499 type:complete len:239 (-) Transcript_23410:38-754(-)
MRAMHCDILSWPPGNEVVDEVEDLLNNAPVWHLPSGNLNFLVFDTFVVETSIVLACVDHVNNETYWRALFHAESQKFSFSEPIMLTNEAMFEGAFCQRAVERSLARDDRRSGHILPQRCALLPLLDVRLVRGDRRVNSTRCRRSLGPGSAPDWLFSPNGTPAIGMVTRSSFREWKWMLHHSPFQRNSATCISVTTMFPSNSAAFAIFIPPLVPRCCGPHWYLDVKPRKYAKLFQGVIV